MSDLISRSALLESLMHCDGLGRKSLDTVLQRINEQPTAEVVEVVHGEWIRQNKEKIWGKSTEIVCSICGKKSWLEYDFCPNCGADMRKVNKAP